MSGIAGDTRVWIDGRGMWPISELVGQTCAIATHANGLAFQPAQVVEAGTRSLVQITTREGIVLRLTADRRVVTDHGDVAAAELRPTGRLQLLHAPSLAVNVDAPKVKLAEIVGWITARGSIRDGEARLAFGPEDSGASERLTATLAAFVGGNASSPLGGESLNYERRLCQMLTGVGIDGTLRHSLPEWVWRGSNEVVIGYLRGVFSAVAHIDDAELQIVLPAHSIFEDDPSLCRAAQLLLLRCGVRSARSPGRRHERDHLVISRGSVATFATTIGLFAPPKLAALEALRTSIKPLGPPTAKDDTLRAPRYVEDPDNEDYDDDDGLIAEADVHRDKALLKYRAAADRRVEAGWVSVASVERDVEDVVFDLREALPFFANGVLVR